MVTKKLHLHDAEEALLLLGQHDKNLKTLERRWGVQIFVKNDEGRENISLSVRGAPPKVERALETLENMRENLRRGKQLNMEPLEQETLEIKGEGAIYTSSSGKQIRPMTANQKKYVETIQAHDMVIGIGPAGTGKTFLAVVCALAALKLNRVHRIVLTRPVVEAGEKLGFLPGDFYEKVTPYLKPIYDAFLTLLGPERFRVMREEETIEIVPLAYMRGRTLEEAFIILDEAQNTTNEQMKMFLTRMGKRSKVVITGDVTQIDLESSQKSGLVHIESVLKDVEGVHFVRFNEEDVVRHELVKRIIRAYDAWEKRPK